MGQIQNLDMTPEIVQNSTELIPTIKKVGRILYKPTFLLYNVLQRSVTSYNVV